MWNEVLSGVLSNATTQPEVIKIPKQDNESEIIYYIVLAVVVASIGFVFIKILK